MIKNVRTIDVVIYENQELKDFYDKRESHRMFDTIIQEIQTDFTWLQSGYVRHLKGGDLEIIALDKPIDEFIEEVNEVIENYELGDYYD